MFNYIFNNFYVKIIVFLILVWFAVASLTLPFRISLFFGDAMTKAYYNQGFAIHFHHFVMCFLAGSSVMTCGLSIKKDYKDRQIRKNN